MQLARVKTDQGVVHVRVDGETWIPISDPYLAFADGIQPTDLGDPIVGDLLAPCVPTLIVGIAQNGPEHPSPVQAWLKSPRTVVASGTAVELRRDAGQTVAEAEVAVVIGRDTTGLTEVTAADYVLGITAVNDLSSPDRTASDPRNFESKAGVGYTPLGPSIDTAMSINDDIPYVLRVDGEDIRVTSSAALPASIAQALAYVCGWLTLGPGDVVMMGAPFTAAPITPGALVEVGVGHLRLATPTN